MNGPELNNFEIPRIMNAKTQTYSFLFSTSLYSVADINPAYLVTRE